MKWGNTYLHKNTYINTHGNIIHNSKEEKLQSASTNKWINEMWHIHMMGY